MFYKKGVLRNFEKFTGKHLRQSLFFRPEGCNFIKKETLAQVYFCEFCEISMNTFGWLLLLSVCERKINLKLKKLDFFPGGKYGESPIKKSE